MRQEYLIKFDFKLMPLQNFDSTEMLSLIDIMIFNPSVSLQFRAAHIHFYIFVCVSVVHNAYYIQPSNTLNKKYCRKEKIIKEKYENVKRIEFTGKKKKKKHPLASATTIFKSCENQQPEFP